MSHRSSVTACRLAACVGVLLGACDDASRGALDDLASDAGSLDAGDAAESGQADGAVPDASVARPVDVRAPQTNVSFETAKRVQTDGSTALQDERSATQVDFYTFAAKAGAFYEITTDLNAFSPDNSIELYDAQQALLAANDDGSIWAGDAIDARLIFRAREAADYFVRVEDRWTPPVFFSGSSLPLLFYHLRVRELDANTPGIALEGAAEVTPVAFAMDEATGFAYATLVGESTGAGLDAFAFTGLKDQVLVGRMLFGETQIAGATPAWAEVEVANADDQVLAHIDRSLGQQDLHPPITDADYVLRVDTLDTASASEHGGFYALDVVLLPDNPREQDDVGNDAVAGAEAIEMEGMFPRRGLLLGTLHTDDVDHYKFDADANELASVVCEAESGGSPVRGLHAELLDDTEQVLGSGVESPSENLQIPAVLLDDTGTYYLRLSADSMPVDEAHAWVRCAVTVGP